MQLFYNSDIDNTTISFTFDKEESRHIVKVLRKKEGDKLFVTNGLGQLFTCEIISASDHKCAVRIASTEKQLPSDFQLHMVVAPTKMNDRYEWFLEKATEIGVTEITPIICDHSERNTLKTERMTKVILSAMKQSLRYHLPKLNDPISFSEFMKGEIVGQKFIAHCEDGEKKLLKSALKPNSDTIILIGPEGDFSPKEIKLALDKGFQPVSLGNTRLRTETAAIVAVHSFAFVNE